MQIGLHRWCPDSFLFSKALQPLLWVGPRGLKSYHCPVFRLHIPKVLEIESVLQDNIFRFKSPFDSLVGVLQGPETKRRSYFRYLLLWVELQLE